MKTLFTIILFGALALQLNGQEKGFKWLGNSNEDGVSRQNSFGLSAFSENGKWGFKDLDKVIVIPAIFEEVENFTSALARVKKDGKWGAINYRGITIFPYEFDSIEKFADGRALAKKGNSYYYLSEYGEELLLKDKFSYDSYSSGLAKVKGRKKWGYVDLNGILVIDTKFNKASDFYGDYAIAYKGNKPRLIDGRGDKMKAPFPLKNEFEFSENGTAFIKNDGYYSLVKNDLSSIIGEYKEYHLFHDGLAQVLSMTDVLTYINSDGAVVFSLEGYDDAGNFSEGKAWVKKGNKYGYIDKHGKLLVDLIFDSASDSKNSTAKVSLDGKEGYINITTTVE